VLIRSITSAAFTIAGLAVWSAAAMGVSGAQTLEQGSDPALLRSVAAGPIAGNVASGSAQQPGFDPGPYPNLDACERARAQYYDPSQLECVPV
jgi:hypothetical protein